MAGAATLPCPAVRGPPRADASPIPAPFMPELPEVEVLARHLAPSLPGKSVRAVQVLRPKVLRPTSVVALQDALVGARFAHLTRRGKYLLFTLQKPGATLTVLGHLGMTGRMFLQPARAPLPKHAAVVLELGRQRFVFEDTRTFGRFTLDTQAVAGLGPEPLADDWRIRDFAQALAGSRQSIKVKLLDQAVVAGVGNIYASEALFEARLSPRRAAGRLSSAAVAALHTAIRAVLEAAIAFGSTTPLDWSGREGTRDRLFYYGRAPGTADRPLERLRVYDRAGAPCPRCGTRIRRLVQAARSTYFCPGCQR